MRDLILKNIINNCSKRTKVLICNDLSVRIHFDRAQNIDINGIEFCGVHRLIIDFIDDRFKYLNVYIPVGSKVIRTALIELEDNELINQVIEINETVNQNPWIHVTLK